MNSEKLKVGAVGDDVARLHEKLKARGFEVSPEEVKRKFYGPATRDAVRECQACHGLDATGEVNEATAAVLLTPVVGGPTHPVAATPRPSKDNIRVDTEEEDEHHPNEPKLRVYGIIRNEFGEPLDGGIVAAFERALRKERLLGQTCIREGRYDIHYHRSPGFTAEKDAPDLVLQVFSAAGKELYKSPIHFSVPDEVEINIVLQGGGYKGPSEYDALTVELTPLLDGTSPLELREDGQYQDISFLSGETGRTLLIIGTWVACQRLADKATHDNTPLEPEIFFGFMRQGQPSLLYGSLLEDIKHPDRIALLEDKILQDLSNIGTETQQLLLEKAVVDNLIPSRIKPQIPAILETLRKIKLHYAADITFGAGKGTIGQLLELTPTAKEKQTAFLAAFTAFRGPINEFWKELEADQVLPKETIKNVKISFELGALTRNHIPLVGELKRMFQQGTVGYKRDLAKFSRDDWKQLFQRPGPDGKPIGVPANIDGKDDNAKREQYAAILEQRFQRAYPTTMFSAQLARAEKSPLTAKADVIRFVENNPQFHLDRHRIDQYLAENKDALKGIENPEPAVREIKSVQRVFKLNSTYQAVDALLSKKIDSAQQVYFMGKGQLVTALGESGVNKIEARKIYHKAENAYAMALAWFGSYNAAVNGITPYGAPSMTLDPATKAKLKTLPNLQTLFGSLDYCDCTDCRSVYSPAAYFVDIMHFLSLRGTQGGGINAGKNVIQVLLERRPDLGEIELSCENTNTPLPYIDLVNEVLEDIYVPQTPVTLNGAIEPDLKPGTIKQTVLDELTVKGLPIRNDAIIYAPDIRAQWAIRDQEQAYKIFKAGGALRLLATRQTHLSAAELRANPEYTNVDAYNKLAQEVFPLNLPFDLWSLQVRTYLQHLGVPQPRLFEVFQQKLLDNVTLFPGGLQIDCAWLAITETERKIITGTLAGMQPWDFWGLVEMGNDIPNPENPADPTENISGGWKEVLSHVNVMLHRSGLTYKELLQLLDMKYINPTGNIFIFDTPDSNAANCDTSTFSVRNLTTDALNRIHRFIRLWRKLDWAMCELDLLLPDTSTDPVVIDKQLTDSVLQDISGMNRLRNRFDIDWRTVYSLYHNIDHAPYAGWGTSGAPVVQTLYQRLFRNKLVDAVAVFPESPTQITGPIADKIPGIIAAFRIKEPDLTLILNDLPIDATKDPNTLDLRLIGGGNVGDKKNSWFVLSRIYRVTLLAKGLGLDIDSFIRLKRLSGQDPFASPAATLGFVELADKVSSSGFSVPELDYLLAHRYISSSGVALDDKTIAATIQAVREGLQKIDDDIRIKTEETAQAYVKSKLGLLSALVKDADQIKALAIINGTWEGSSADRNKLIDAYFVNVLDLTVAKVKLSAIPAGLSPADHQAQVDARFAYVQPALESFLLQARKEAFIVQKTAEAFQLDAPSASRLLKELRLTGSADTLLHVINDARLLDKHADGTYKFVTDETNFPVIYKVMRLLHKNALLIGKLLIKADELSWWLDGSHAADMAWMHPKDFPIDATSSIPLAQWEHISDFFGWKHGLPKSTLTAFEFEDQVLDGGASATENIASLAELTAWEEANISALAAAFRWDVKQEFKNVASLIRLDECMAALHRLGVNAARAIEWANPIPTSAHADSLKQTVKSKYDLAQWLQVIQPVQDTFRERKRDALVGWLATHPDQGHGLNWADSNGLYSYFLIDVEMSSCMLTSRLKQAAASVQLFVQRCLMNLEVDIVAKIDLDPKWKQWQWMKYYRIWEANRKIFLYPENWIEPELRDEKSPFFKDLENELMQNDITNDTVEQAYLNYLEKLDQVANLEIRAIYNQIISQDESVLHIFARSRSSLTPTYYYRQRMNGGRWLAWEKIEMDINANHLVAGIHNRRLFLLWPQFLEKSDPPPQQLTIPKAGDTFNSQPTRYWEMRLFWSELKKGKWTPKVLSDIPLRLYQSFTGGDHIENISFRMREKPYLDARVFFSNSPSILAPLSFHGFNKIGKQIDVVQENMTDYLIAGPNGLFEFGLIKNYTNLLYFFYNSFEETGKPHEVDAHKDAESILLLQNLLTPTCTVIDAKAEAFSSQGQFFVWDTHRTYFVDYLWYKYNYYTPSGILREQIVSSFPFFIHYHPFIELFIKELNIWGIKGLLNRQIQVDPASLPNSPPIFNFTDYQPSNNVPKNYNLPDGSASYPIEDVDFTYTGAYASYNWELFFHVPFFIANKLSTNQRFEEALAWYHYIFDPTNTDTTTLDPNTPQQKYWITKPFYETTKAGYYKQKIENLLLAIAQGDAELRAQVEEWRDNPFKPHLIARMRTVAYQKTVLIKYIQTLIAWGDQLFRRDTIETLNEATQLYILAASILGPSPKSVPKKVANPIKTFYQLEQEGIDDFGNVLKQVENLLPTVSSSSVTSDDSPELPKLNVLYFCIPNNINLLALWDTVADRLFKIRHCMNIEGIVRQLPLFEPPIEPGLLVKAAAAGLDIGSILSDINAPMPLYRFNVMIQRAFEITQEVKSLGSAMLAALASKDIEALAQLRSSNELATLDQVRLVKVKQQDEALDMKASFIEAKNVVQARSDHFGKLISDGWNDWEKLSFGLATGAIVAEIVGTVLNAIGTGTSLIPEVQAGAAGFGGSPTLNVTLGGKSVTSSVSKAADVSKGVASILQMGAALTSTIGTYDRRNDDWKFQKDLADKELPQIQKQIDSADIRYQITQQELTNHDKDRDNVQKVDDYLHSKFTNQELYDWMINQLSTVFFQSYQLAYDISKRAERCFRYELGLTDSSYIQFGYWDSLKNGLLSGEKLFYDLKRLESAYYEQNRREYELTKHISLSQLDPVALLKLRQNGQCIIDVSETVFDMDYPGHYFRRMKSVSLSIPCVVGPYATIACTLTLARNSLRKDPALLGGKYERDTLIEDPRFRDEIAAIQSIATSTALNDSGLFELNFRDERYLPFEGAGAISTWQIKLNKDFPQFDFSTITDVVINLSYTAREGGDQLGAKAVEFFNKKMNNLALSEDKKGLFRVYDLRHEYADKWYKFLHPASPGDDQQLVLDDLAARLPYFTKQFNTKKVKRIEIAALMHDAGIYKVMVSPVGTTEADLLALTPDPTYQGLHHALKDLSGSEVDLASWTLKLKADGTADFKSLSAEAIKDLYLIINYSIS